MPRGGARQGAGRKKGSPNKLTADVKEAAAEFTAEALNTLAAIMRGTEEPSAARVAAAKELLDRAHGKPRQSVEASGPGGVPLAPSVVTFALPDNGRS